MRNSVAVVLGLLVAGGTVSAQQYLIATVAGGGLPPTPAPATSVAFGTIGTVATASGNVYFAAGNLVFKVDAFGVLTRVAGSSTFPGYSGDGGLATDARLNQPSGLAVDLGGNVYIADTGNNVIRSVAAATGAIATFAGTGTAGYSGDGGQATGARLNKPQGLAMDAASNLYIADTSNYVVRKVSATGIITTFAGNGTQGDSGDGGPATSAQLEGPFEVAVDGAGNVYILDGGTVREVAAATGTITTVASGSSDCTNYFIYCHSQTPISMAVDDAGNLYITFQEMTAHDAPLTYYISEVAAGTGSTSVVYSPPWDAYWSFMAADGSGNLYLATGSSIQELAVASGALTVVAGGGPSDSGGGGPATAASLGGPSDVAVDGSGNLYIADSSLVRKVAAATGIITTVAGGGSADPGDNGPATNAQLDSPGGVAVDGFGNLYISEVYGNRVRKVEAATGIITTVAGNNGYGYSGDGGPGTSASLEQPGGLAVDGSGNLYIADAGNYVIRKVTAATGIITTVAGNGTRGYSGDGGLATSAQMGVPGGVALDTAGNLYIADAQNGAIRKVAAGTQIITTVATITGGSVAVDASGSLYITDSQNNVIRKIAAGTTIVTTVAGNGTAGYSGDGGPATSAQLNGPEGLAVDRSGNAYFADTGNGVVRMLMPLATRALLGVTSSHSGYFARVVSGASFSIVVSNSANAGPTSGAVTVTETLPAGLTLVSMAGAGWNCSGAVCTRSDVLSAGASYPTILVAVNVAADAPSQVTNQVLVSGGGSQPTGTTDLTTISGPPPAPVLTFPANGATGVSVAPTLTWSGAAESFDVYFGTSSTPPLVASTTGTTYAPGTLSPSTTYHWYVMARNSFGGFSAFMWSFTTGVAPVGSRFVPVAPCRVADTRRPGGPFGGPSMTAGSMRSFAIPSGGCGIPATAQAYSLNVTVVPAGPLSFLTLWPAGQTQPVVSTLNSEDGSVVANAAIVPAGTGGAVSVFVAGDTDVILDIDGYFDASGAAGASSFYAATPCRVADTRGPTGQFGGPSMTAQQVRDFPIPLSSCGIPAAATAYSLNVTAIPGTDFLAYLTTFPTGSARPLVSTLNSWTGEVRANADLVPVGANDSVSVFVTDPANVILDINGYFGQPGGAGELAFYPVTPCRVVDTREADGPFGGPEMEARSVRSFALPVGGCPLPSNAAAYSLNVTVVPDGVLSFLTAWPVGVAQPLVSTLNSFDGSVVANAAIVPAGTNGAISIYVTDRTQAILDINGYFAP